MCSPYLSKFLGLKCAGDILNVLNPIRSGVEKEVSEAWAIMSRVRDTVMAEPNRYNILELCGGNPTTGTLLTFLLPVTKTVVVDKDPVNRPYDRIKKFTYLEKNIFNDSMYDLIDSNTIMVAAHPCRNLAVRIIHLFNNSNAKELYLMPCCHGQIPSFSQKNFLMEKLGAYLTWAYWLSTLCCGSIEIDKKCTSPKNAVIIVRRA